MVKINFIHSQSIKFVIIVSPSLNIVHRNMEHILRFWLKFDLFRKYLFTETKKLQLEVSIIIIKPFVIFYDHNIAEQQSDNSTPEID